jgi:hypothetical protein
MKTYNAPVIHTHDVVSTTLKKVFSTVESTPLNKRPTIASLGFGL